VRERPADITGADQRDLLAAHASSFLEVAKVAAP
jgi:hypothetical protein